MERRERDAAHLYEVWMFIQVFSLVLTVVTAVTCKETVSDFCIILGLSLVIRTTCILGQVCYNLQALADN